MTAFTFPSAITPNRSQIQVIDNTGSFKPSPFTGYMQSFGRFGSRMGLVMEFDNLDYDSGQLMRGFVMHLHGMEHRVLVHDHSYQQRGTMNGSPRVNGAQSSGYVLTTDGWDAGITLRAGDQFSVVNGDGIPELKTITADTVVNGSGEADVPIWPDIHGTLANDATLDKTDPQGHFMLNPGVIFANEPGDFSTFSLSLIEDWL